MESSIKAYQYAGVMLAILMSASLASGPARGETIAHDTKTFVEAGKPLDVMGRALDGMRQVDGALVMDDPDSALFGGSTLAGGDFRIEARLMIPEGVAGEPSFMLEGNYHTPKTPPQGRHIVRIWLDSEEGQVFAAASGTRMFRMDKTALGKAADAIPLGKPFSFTAERSGDVFTLAIDGNEVFRTEANPDAKAGSVGFAPRGGAIHVLELRVTGNFHQPSLPHKDVWMMGHKGYSTYRNPSLCTTHEGTVLAFAEARNPGVHHGDVDVVMKRSTDGGKTWSSQEVVWNPGDDAYFARDPSPVVDRSNGRIHLVMGANPPLGEDSNEPGPRRLFVMRSDDDGQSWSDPEPLGLMAQREDMGMLTAGPAHGFQLKQGPHKGRLVVPCYSEIDEEYRSCVVYSDDNGANWKLSSIPDVVTNESTATELTGGRVMLNMRANARYVAISEDGGATFGPVRKETELPAIGCDATLLRYSWPGDSELGGKNRILYSSPDPQGRGGEAGRQNMTIQLSEDDGETWSVKRVLYPGYAAYSGMTVLPDGRVGILYEKDGYRRLTFAAFSIEWLLGAE